jgi:hypothetical protein
MIEGMTTPSVRCHFSGQDVRFIAVNEEGTTHLVKQRWCRKSNGWKKTPGTNRLDDVVLAMMQASADQTEPQGPLPRYGWGLNGRASS